MPDFSNQDLRDRSFKNQILDRTNFSGSDIRGCNFSGTQLIQANFDRIKSGGTIKQMSTAWGTAIATFLITSYALLYLISTALGQTVGDQGWALVLVLQAALWVAGTGAAIKAWQLRRSSDRQLLNFLSLLSSSAAFSLSGSGALTGFFYAGTGANNDVRAVIAGAMVGGILGAIAGIWSKKRLMAIVILTAGMVANYGFAFMMSAIASASLSVQNLLWSIPLAIIALGYVGLTLTCGIAAVQQIQRHLGTSFRQANLTDASFHQAQLQGADFEGAIGFGDRA